MDLEKMRLDFAMKQKKGLHFILASIVIWSIILLIHKTSLSVFEKNLLTFYSTAFLMPLAFIISKFIKIDFYCKGHPLKYAGILFSVNQILYLPIAMWIAIAVPDKLVMVLGIIFGAHLLPFSWLYKSKTYLLLSIIIPIVVLVIGIKCPQFIVAIIMVLLEIIFSLCLILEISSKGKVSRI